MKVLCDVCAAEAASVFCCADEAALCDACDRRVHRANKLAGKHRRLSLLHPSAAVPLPPPPPPPLLCDICQEKRGLLFCKEDRAILCRECDVPVHTASELAMRHSRFLLTGVRLSSAPAASPAPPSEEEENSSSVGGTSRGGGAAACSAAPAPRVSDSGGGSSISEYLTKTLPGWHVEDFLMDDAAACAAAVPADGFYQGGASQIAGLVEMHPTWVPPEQLFCDVGILTGGSGCGGGAVQGTREHWVPQVHTELSGSKRSKVSTYSYW